MYKNMWNEPENIVKQLLYTINLIMIESHD